MQHLDRIIDILINNFDFAYMLVVNLITYFAIKFIDIANGDKHVSRTIKRLVLLIVIIVVGIAYHLEGSPNIQLLNSAILAPVAYSWLFRPILIKIGVGYKRFDDYLLMKDNEIEEK